MSTIYILALFFISMIFLMVLYLKVADKYHIVDKPNQISSHTTNTVRGAGIIFPIAVMIFALLFGFNYPWFLLGLLLVSVLSFVDDMKELSIKIRILFQFIAIFLLFIDTSLYTLPFYWLITIAIFAVGALNAMNFMDGINGITGSYSLITMLSLIYINERIIPFDSSLFMLAIVIVLLIFLFFNFRTQARCFAGDVGSISIAFIIIFLITRLIIVSDNMSYICLLLLYGLDSVTTVFFRIIRKENIFEAHRYHFYQYLVNERKLPQLWIASGYGLLQLMINVFLIFVLPTSWQALTGFVFSTGCLFILLRILVEGKDRLLKPTLNM